MKKIKLLIGGLLLCSTAFSMTLDNLIEQLEVTGYSRQYRELEQKQLAIDYKEVDRIDREGLELNASGKYTDDSKGERTGGSFSAAYDFLKYEGEYDYEFGGENKQLLGFEKNIKDIFYGERKYSKNIFTIDEIIRLNMEDARMENEIVSLVNTYRLLMDTQLELKLKNGLLPSLEADARRLEKGHETGQSSQLDYKYSKMRLENLNNDIKQLELDIERIKKTFKSVFNLDLYSDIKYSKLEILDEKDITNIGTRDLENINLFLEKVEEEKKYSEYDNKWDDVKAGTFYDIKNDGWLVRLSIDKTLFEYDKKSATYEVNKQRFEVEREKLKNSLESTQENYFNKYSSLIKEIENLKRQDEVDKMTYEIYKLNYNQGNETYLNYIEKYEDSVITSIQLEKKENELTAFIYEMQYRR